MNDHHHLHIPVVVLLVLIIFTTPLTTTGNDSSSLSSTQVLSPNCTRKCGNMEIWYPFGVEEGCYLKDDGSKAFEYFKVNCSSNSLTTPTPLWDNSGIELWSISVETSEFRIKHDISYTCYNSQQQVSARFSNYARTGSFTFSSTKNIFVVIGCDSYAWFNLFQRRPRVAKRYYNTGCMTNCKALEDVVDGECNGVGCCQLPLPNGLFYIETDPGAHHNHSKVMSFNPCTAAFPVEKAVFRFYPRNVTRRMDLLLSHSNWVPVVVDWFVGEDNCSVAQQQGNCLCKKNTICQQPNNNNNIDKGYICRCKPGFHGNPYHPLGCIDIDECESGKHKCEKPEYCVNDVGDYHCQCPKGYKGSGTETDRCISNAKKWLIPVIISAGGGGGIILLLGIAFIMYMKREKKKLKKLHDSFFQQNGGTLLNQKLLGQDVMLKVFTAQDLVNATNNYDDNHIIGRGGFGIVYKGTLTNNQHIAIKRSIKVDPSQVEQFINEVIVLSQINNRNVVKLLGCCLETEVPLLVYEFIINGTLYDHLNDAVKASILTWSTRLKIALEVANVLSYLHNTISTPIIHRDMKSMNILLDENYTAKVADFGASRVVPTDQGRLATMVLGTWGYLDPEYMQTSKLTEKSDVYSFGVVLAEILTRKKVISNDRPETERCLAMHFLLKMRNGTLFDILDHTIVGEGTIEQIHLVANLAKQCLMVKGEYRPTMKEVARELETIERKGLNQWNTKDESSFQEDHNVMQGAFQRYEMGGSSSGIDSDLYPPQPASTLGTGRKGSSVNTSVGIKLHNKVRRLGNPLPYPFGIEEAKAAT